MMRCIRSHKKDFKKTVHVRSATTSVYLRVKHTPPRCGGFNGSLDLLRRRRKICHWSMSGRLSSEFVDRRYKQYYHQMQIIISSFQVIAEGGAAKTYTSLALEPNSCRFRCLRDAIDSQVTRFQ
ncbi:putative POX domain-containing protein [Helianthus annuus]|uniref:POX domain-containing protein n=1 Tax=Helianthus annuus TaxID=4232 RepID=A0A251VN00_HELAN|nr:putative POX domain-containing protein [Helianthus annuus]KAJ0622545.1 putative POX domain-containing protein [Helianthus annuus]